MINKLLKDIHTCKDNNTYDQVKILGSIGFVLYNALWAADVYYTHTFEARDYAEGLAILLAAIGAALWAKKDTEPNVEIK